MNTTDDQKELDWLRMENPDMFSEYARKFSDMMMIYRCAIREVQTKLEVLNDEFSVRYRRNPIVSIKTRVKKPLSIARKMQKNNIPFTTEAMVENMHDIAGVRVTCAFIDDIYHIAQLLAQQDDIRVHRIKDYIQMPKPNGYRSYHMIVEIPVFFSEKKEYVKVEVQIRTMAMDFWASLEHQIRYKKQINDYEGLEKISSELLECAEIIAQTDVRMQNIKEMIGEFCEID
ncbi:MAG: GTP pyrophosphokinase [Ruminococcus sp.]|jgi:putative GTP pyrophosphokinase